MDFLIILAFITILALILLNGFLALRMDITIGDDGEAEEL